MPSYRGHIVGGTVAYLICLHVIKYAQPNMHVIFQGFAFCLLGSLFPDVDIKSKGQKVFYNLILIFLLYCLYMKKWTAFVIVSLLGITPMLVRHRGLFHQMWFLLALTLTVMLCMKSIQKPYEDLLLANCCFFFVGCWSHVVLDRLFSKVKWYFIKR